MWDFGRPDHEREHLADDLAMPGTDLELDSWLVTGAGGVPVAFGLVHDPRPQHAQDAYARVHPAHRGRGIGGFLVDVMEARARERVPSGSSNALVYAFTTATDTSAGELLDVRGYEPVRHLWHMERDLGEEPAPEPPPGIAVRSFRPGEDDRLLYEVMEASFAEHWGFQPTPFDEW